MAITRMSNYPLVVLLGVGLALHAVAGRLSAESPAIVVEADYAGANAAVVADMLAAPIEHQIKGVAKVRYLRSRSTDDGKYTLVVVFEQGSNLEQARQMVQNRVDLALPVLPDVVKRQRIQVKESAPAIQMIACLTSPDLSRDIFYLGNFADTVIKGELTQVEGVARVGLVGNQNYSVRVRLDLERLAARNLTASDVAKALKEYQPKALPSGRDKPPKGKEVGVAFNLLGRLADLEQLEDIVLQNDDQGTVVHLKDVGTIELGASCPQSEALSDGAPAVLLCVSSTRQARPKQLHDAVRQRLDQCRKRLPPGVDLSLALDFTSNVEGGSSGGPEYLLVDLTLPTAASPQRILEALRRCGMTLQHTAGVRKVLALSENPFDVFGGGPCLLVSFDPPDQTHPSRKQFQKNIRLELDKMGDMAARLRAPLWTRRFDPWEYPIGLAVHGPEGPATRDFAQKLEEKLSRSNKLVDVAMDPAARSQPRLQFDIDRTRAKNMEVSINDLSTTLETLFGASFVGVFPRAGRQGRILVRADAVRIGLEDVKQLKVRNSQGKMVPIGALVAVHAVEDPTVIDRFDTQPMVAITAKSAPDVSLKEAFQVCERQAEELRKDLRLSPDYRLTRLQEMPEKK
jgi:multidrug efflux pump subunit AcrB